MHVMHLGILVFISRSYYCSLSLYFIMFKFYSTLVYAFHFLYYTYIIMFLSCLSMFLLFIMFS